MQTLIQLVAAPASSPDSFPLFARERVRVSLGMRLWLYVICTAFGLGWCFLIPGHPTIHACPIASHTHPGSFLQNVEIMNHAIKASRAVYRLPQALLCKN